MSDEGPTSKVNQFLELFGMSAIEALEERSTTEHEGPPPLCAACYNETIWSSKERRWRCPDHPQARLRPPSPPVASVPAASEEDTAHSEQEP